jgi:DNA polymerase theta
MVVLCCCSVQPSPPADQLAAYLPPDVVDVFHQAGVTGNLYPWQAECLCQPGVLKGRNLVRVGAWLGGLPKLGGVVDGWVSG